MRAGPWPTVTEGEAIRSAFRGLNLGIAHFMETAEAAGHSIAPLAWAAAQPGGRVTDEAGSSVPSATLTLVNGSTGQRYAARSREDGRYSFENVDVGGPYTLAARALGFERKTSTPFNLQISIRTEISMSSRQTWGAVP